MMTSQEIGSIDIPTYNNEQSLVKMKIAVGASLSEEDEAVLAKDIYRMANGNINLNDKKLQNKINTKYPGLKFSPRLTEYCVRLTF